MGCKSAQSTCVVLRGPPSSSVLKFLRPFDGTGRSPDCPGRIPGQAVATGPFLIWWHPGQEERSMFQKLHHVAYRCRDAQETVEFYTKVLGLKYAAGE